MKKVLVLFSVLFLSTSLHAWKIDYSVDAGPSIPAGDIADAASVGYTAGLRTSTLLGPGAIVSSLHYSAWNSKLTFDSPDYSAIDIMGNYKFNFLKGAFSPYVVGGGGLRIARTSEFTLDLGTAGKTNVSSTSNTNALFNFGGGADFSVGSTTMFIEATYQIADGADSVPISIGIRF